METNQTTETNSSNSTITNTQVLNATNTTEAAPEVKVTETQKPTAPAPIYMNGKKFNNAEELAKYTSELELKQYTQPAKPTVTEDEPLDELIFKDTNKAINKIKESVKAELSAVDQQKAAQAKAWADFSTKYPDLAEERELVEMQAKMSFNELKGLHAEQAYEEIAKRVRGRISKWRSTPKGEGETLPSGKAQSAPGSSQQVITKREEPSKAVSFVDQMKQTFSKKKAKTA